MLEWECICHPCYSFCGKNAFSMGQLIVIIVIIIIVNSNNFYPEMRMQSQIKMLETLFYNTKGKLYLIKKELKNNVWQWVYYIQQKLSICDRQSHLSKRKHENYTENNKCLIFD